MGNVAKRCQSHMCDKQASYNFEGMKAEYCRMHKDNGMINVRIKGSSCAAPQCDKTAVFNYDGKKRGLYCGEHRKRNMINVKSRRCCEPGCSTTPVFNDPGETKGLYCNIHKKTGMINVKKKKCRQVGCDIYPVYNLPGETRGLYCVKHKEKTMIDVENRKCLEKGCIRQPLFNLPGKERGAYCSKHKKPRMVNVIGLRCKHSGCKTCPRFNYEDQTSGLYCSTHKKRGMIDVRKTICSHDGCLGVGSYGLPGQFASTCSEHATEGMIFRPRRRCRHADCEEFATMGAAINTGGYCEDHAPEDYISLLQFNCKGCKLLMIVDSEGYCIYCKPESFKRYKKAREYKVVNWLLSDKKTSHFSSMDSVLPETKHCEGSKRYRPDIAYSRKSGYYIIIEVDENQHSSAEYRSCDLPRIINLQQDIMAPVYIIRYNPDPYRYKGQRVNPTDHVRKQTLLDWVKWTMNYSKDDVVEDGLHVLYLFYDGYVAGKEKWKTIDALKYVMKK